MSGKVPVDYSDTIREEDTIAALTTLKVSLFPDDTQAVAIDLEGKCPRCGDPVQYRRWLVTVAGASRMSKVEIESLVARFREIGIGQPQGDETFDLSCTCDVIHPRHPKDKHGCGARFRIRVTWP